MDSEQVIILVVIILTFLALTLWFSYRFSDHLRRRPLSGAEGLLGVTAIAKTDIAPRGSVLLRGELWDAMSDEMIHQGEAVKILAVDGLTLKVKRQSGERTVSP